MNLVFKALSDPTRRQILQLLRKQPMNAASWREAFPYRQIHSVGGISRFYARPIDRGATRAAP